MEKEKAVKVIISGKVQGVGFRFFIEKNAKSNNIKGYVKNLSSGGVEAFFQGPGEKVNEMINLCKKGPLTANVKNIDIQEQNPQEFNSFKVTG
ncbi:MAG TPA: acylphosphatase [Candidatus Nanoarchaeia archaeon]|nr:acylphosphatase [Candidatus Nanoarchaeia archaeon]